MKIIEIGYLLFLLLILTSVEVLAKGENLDNWKSFVIYSEGNENGKMYRVAIIDSAPKFVSAHCMASGYVGSSRDFNNNLNLSHQFNFIAVSIDNYHKDNDCRKDDFPDEYVISGINVDKNKLISSVEFVKAVNNCKIEACKYNSFDKKINQMLIDEIISIFHKYKYVRFETVIDKLPLELTFCESGNFFRQVNCKVVSVSLDEASHVSAASVNDILD